MENNTHPPDHTQPQNPNLSTNPYTQSHNVQLYSCPNFSYYPLHPPQNPNPNIIDPKTLVQHYGVQSSQPDASIYPPGIDSYSAMNALQPPIAGYVAQSQTDAAYHQQMHNWASTTFYQNPTLVAASSAAYTDGSTITPNGTQPLVPSNLYPTQLTNPVAQSYMNGALKKGSKKTKIVQSAYCEVCNINCTSEEVLDNHKLGKKHKKNLDKIEEAKRIANQPTLAPTPVLAPAPVNKLIGPVEKPSKKKRAALAATEDLDTKRKKLMEGGAAAEGVRICTICNVACNSQIVLNYHLVGQKHASMVKKLAG